MANPDQADTDGDGQGDACDPTPNGGLLTFSSTRDGNAEIYVIRPDGTGERRLTSHAALDAEPTWSPDGTKIAFTSSRTGNGDIYVMNADGSGLTRLTTDNAVDTSPAWSPDGTRIAFSTNRHGVSNFEIYVMATDGSGQRRLTTHAAADTLPSWSPDGTKIAFTSSRTGNGDIYVMDANGTGLTRLTTHAATEIEPAWSPDGDQDRVRHQPPRRGQLRDLLDGDRRRCPDSPDHQQRRRHPAGVVAGRQPGSCSPPIATTSSNFDLYTMSATGGAVARATTHAGERRVPGLVGPASSLVRWKPTSSNRGPPGEIDVPAIARLRQAPSASTQLRELHARCGSRKRPRNRAR